MMKYLIVLSLFFCAGCDLIAPQIDKAQTERKQYEELKKQTAALERIATAIENRR